jgi:uncharacterized protein (DUF427 family)
VIAASDTTVILEGNHYFPGTCLVEEYFTPSSQTSVCPWKGIAHYYHITVDGETSENAAWYYPEPHPEAEELRNRVAFWKAVSVEDD